MNNPLITRFANSPVMVSRERADWLNNCLHMLAAELPKLREGMATGDDYWPEEDSWYAQVKPYKVENGTLSIPVKGVLLHDFEFQAWDYATGYTYIQKAWERGMTDPAVQRIALVINSGGGEVAGNFDLVDKMYATKEKPVCAMLNEHAYSAAFSIASVADRIIIPRTGGVGSVGVVTAHADYSKALDDAGVKITFIYAGDHKVDGNPYEPLPEDVKNRMQARIDGLYDIFVSTVARNLGIAEEAVRATEALTYSAEEAVSVGFAHEIRAFEEAMASFGGRFQTIGDVTMSKEDQNAQATVDLDAARAEGRKEGALAERDRIQGILACDEAKNRQDLAFHLSMKSDLSVEAAQAILAAAPAKAEQSENPGSAFEAAMAKGNPELGAEGGEQKEISSAQQLINDYKAYTGFGSK